MDGRFEGGSIMRLEKTLLYTLATALIAVPVFAADASDTDDGSMQDARQPAMDGMKDDTGMKSDRHPASGGESMESADTMNSANTQYVVEQGDTLAEIAQKKLGSADKWKEIARANDIDDPDSLRVGQKLSIPSASSSESPQRSKL
jgi:nucleoid-associated protein YgaU